MRLLAFSGRTAKEILRDPLNLGFGIGFPVVLLLLLSAIQANVPVSLFEIQHLAPGIAVFGLVNPVVNVLLSAVLNGEPLFEWQYLAALALVCVGIWLVNKAPKKEHT